MYAWALIRGLTRCASSSMARAVSWALFGNGGRGHTRSRRARDCQQLRERCHAGTFDSIRNCNCSITDTGANATHRLYIDEVALDDGYSVTMAAPGADAHNFVKSGAGSISFTSNNFFADDVFCVLDGAVMPSLQRNCAFRIPQLRGMRRCSPAQRLPSTAGKCRSTIWMCAMTQRR